MVPACCNEVRASSVRYFWTAESVLKSNNSPSNSSSFKSALEINVPVVTREVTVLWEAMQWSVSGRKEWISLVVRTLKPPWNCIFHLIDFIQILHVINQPVWRTESELFKHWHDMNKLTFVIGCIQNIDFSPSIKSVIFDDSLGFDAVRIVR